MNLGPHHNLNTYNGGMRRIIQRHGYEPRMEMTPLLDVIFLLLTFFIYSMVLTVRAQVLPVTLPAITAGEVPADAQIAGITVDAAGQLFLNRKPITREELEASLKELSEREKPPAVFIALEAGSDAVDRGPIFIDLIDTMRRLGIENFNVVGTEKD